MLGDAERIVKIMISEMDSVDKKLDFRKEKSGQYARLLLTNLNLCEKYVRLEDRYRILTEKLETINRKLDSATIVSITNEETQSAEAVLQNSDSTLFLKEDQISIIEEAPTSEEEQTASDSISEVIGIEQPTQPTEPPTQSTESTEQPTQPTEKPEIPNWKLTQSYLSLKQKAMERIIQIRGQSQATEVSPPEVPEQPVSVSPIDSSIEKVSPPLEASLESIILKTEECVPSQQHNEPTYTITTPTNSHQYININKPNITKPKVYRKGEFQLPSLSFLKNTSNQTEIDQQSIRRDAELLEKKLGYFGIKGEVMGVSPGPVITTFEYRPEPGIKISKIVNLADDLALALSAFSIRIVAPIPGKDVMGIEIPNIKKSLVPFIDIVSSEDFTNSKSKLPICLGKDIIGNPVVVELDRMPHLLIAGATGTGKSVGLNAMITSILYKSTPEEVRFLMVDPKRIELSFYNEIPHLLTPVITDMKKATIAMQWLVREMDRRYNLLAKSQVRHIEQYNQKIKNMCSQNLSDSTGYQLYCGDNNRFAINDNIRFTAGDNGGDSEESKQLPYIVVIIDELADLMMTASRDIEFSLTRLAQMARAAGIHLILATQRPSVDVLTGIIKANFPTRISFQVSSKTDSRTIIDSNGAETLLGNGDMLFVPPGTARLTRVHGTYLSEDELMEITAFLKSQGKPEYVLDVITETDEEPPQESMDDDYDDKYNEALEFVIATKQASISGIQRALRVGYNRAARIIDIMEKRGIVGPSDGVKPRRVIVENIDY
ncbi:MAG: DNA translocase FtsK [Desulfamplus sp.]|nr:DNA translocase FtsK [Desulfamplus sp.]